MAQLMNMPRMWSFGVALGLIVGGLTLVDKSRGQRSFVARSEPFTIAGVVAKPRHHELRAGTVAQLLNRRFTNVVIFDLRSAAEFAVSHLPRAVHVNAELTAEAFVAQYGGAMQDRVVVFYCTAGVHSGAFVAVVERELVMAGARSVHSLKDGVIGWANDGRWLHDAHGLTSTVHPGHADLVPKLRTPMLARFEAR
ncbi:MAG: rhodanese-like domain-containing protein [Hyphomicrobiaceae bacterium]|nr:rhodanese-like domain-containing protein [Hyphomicrobiaceae bacterium]